MLGQAAFGNIAVGAPEHEVLDSDIGEGATHHDFMIAAPRAVLIEVGRAHLMLGQIFPGRRCQLDRAGRRDVIGGDLVAEHRQDPRVDDIDDRFRLFLHAFEIGRVLNVGRAHVPAIGFALDSLDLAPVGVALEHIGVALLEDRRSHELLHERVDLLRRRPDVS